ncbi:MAG: hypothetical protein ACRC1P_09525 [Cellulosilyticaceae bacterium]
MLNVTTKTIKILDTTGIKRGMILSLEDTMSCNKFNVVVKEVYDHDVLGWIKVIAISGKDIGKEIVIDASHTYAVKKMEIVEKPLVSLKNVVNETEIQKAQRKILEDAIINGITSKPLKIMY